MNARRALAAAAVALGLVAPSAVAGGSVALDGTKRTRTSYAATLTQPAASVSPDRTSANSDPTMPSLADCTATSCDITELRLTLPKGSTVGWFEANLSVQRSLNVTVVLYDANGRAVEHSDVTRPCCTGPAPQGNATDYAVPLAVSRLAAGKYRLVVFDRGGVGPFSASLEFHAHPPDRKAHK
jgi:hypothetical protein